MTNYNNGKIYKIESTLGDMVYYGSTTKQYLSQRMTKHRSDYNRWLSGKDAGKYRSFDLFDEYGIENCKIVLVENFPCKSKDELTAREAYYIRNFDCGNKCVPGRTYKEYIEDNKDKILERKKQYRENNKDKIKEYYQNNKDKILEQNKQYREDNKDKIADQGKQYREDNKDKIKEYYQNNKDKILDRRKQYRENNKDKIAEQQKITYTCICGSCICKGNKGKHEQTKKHIKFLESQ